MKAMTRLTQCSSLGLLIFAGAVCLAKNHESVVQSWRTDDVESVAFSPDGKMILSASEDKMLKLWDVSTGRLMRTFKGHTGEVARAVFSPDGKLIASISRDDLKIWDVASGKVIRDVLDEAAKQGGTSNRGPLAVSPDGKLLAASSDRLKVWEVPSGTLLKTFDDSVLAVKFSPDGKLIAAVGHQGKLKLWDVASGSLLRTLEAEAELEAESIAFTPDGKLLAVRTKGTVDFWDTADWYVVRSIKPSSSSANRLSTIAVSPDGKKLFVSNTDGESDSRTRNLELWNAASLGLIKRIDLYDLGYLRNDNMRVNSASAETREIAVVVKSVSFSPDSKTFVTAGRDQIILWDAESGQIVRVFGAR